MSDSKKKEYDVIVIGGGATGAGTARDCAMRGLKTLLVERLDFTAGATGRNHGLLHSGARYAHTDPESAAECIKENMILRRIARHCVEDTGGLFITLSKIPGFAGKLYAQGSCRCRLGVGGVGACVLSPVSSINPKGGFSGKSEKGAG